MKIQVISLFPEMILAGLKAGVVANSIDKKILSLSCLNPRQFSKDSYQRIDDSPFGGDDGMIMMPEPLERAVAHLRVMNAASRSEWDSANGSDDARDTETIIYLSARGEIFNDQMARHLSRKESLLLICGRYGGVDQRFLSKNNVQEVCVGDYVLSGGELPALVLIDAVARHIPGVLGNIDSAVKDSFANGLLEAPSFTRPRQWHNLDVPEILLSGDHKRLQTWREHLSWLTTAHNRSDLFLKANISKESLHRLKMFFKQMPEDERYVCGLHDSQKILKLLDQKENLLSAPQVAKDI